MAESYAVTSPEQMRRILAMVNRFEREGVPSFEISRPHVGTSVIVKNSSGHTVPPYGIVQPIGMVVENSRNYVEITRPVDLTSALQGPFYLNGPYEILDDEYGTMQSGPVFRVVTDGGTYVVNQRLGPTTSSFLAGSGCVWKVIGDDDIGTNIKRVKEDPTPIIGTVKTPGISANSTGTFFYREPVSGDWSVTTIEYTGYNDSTSALATGTKVLAFPIDARWKLVEIC